MGKRVTAKQILCMIERQGYQCALSGRPLKPETASLDHIIPLSRGGEHSPENVWVVDHQVNLAKGTMTVDEFVGMCRDVVTLHDEKTNACRLTEEVSDVERVGPPQKKLFS